MTITVANLLARCSKTLYDETNVVYAQAELLDHLNTAVAEIVQLDAKAYMVNQAVRLAPGSQQQLPGDAVALVDVKYNLAATQAGTAGAPGRAITAVAMSELQEARPDWHASPPAATVRHYCADPRDPRRFYVWPPQADPPGFAQVVYQGVPEDVDLAGDFPLPDLYAEAAYLFVLYHALLRREPHGDPQRAQFFYTAFLQALDQDVRNIARIQAGRPEGPKPSSFAPELGNG